MVVSIAQAQFFFLAFTRIMAGIIHVPVLGGQTIPTQYRIALGGVLAIVLVPWQVLPPETQSMPVLIYAVAIGREILLGTLMGYAANLTFGAVLIAGEVMGLGSGFSSGHIFNPTLGDSGSSYNQFFVMMATLFFLVMNGHHLFLIALQRTFLAIPLTSAWALGSELTVIRMTAQLISAGIQLALPVMCALLLTDITLGLLARVAPQVQVYFLGLPLKVGVSLVGMGLLFVAIMPLLENLYSQLGSRMILLLGK